MHVRLKWWDILTLFMINIYWLKLSWAQQAILVQLHKNGFNSTKFKLSVFASLNLNKEFLYLSSIQDDNKKLICAQSSTQLG